MEPATKTVGVALAAAALCGLGGRCQLVGSHAGQQSYSRVATVRMAGRRRSAEQAKLGAPSYPRDE